MAFGGGHNAFNTTCCAEITYHELLATPRGAIEMKAAFKKASSTKRRSDTGAITSEMIAEQTAAFIKAGGTITKIRFGARSGMNEQETSVGKEKG